MAKVGKEHLKSRSRGHRATPYPSTSSHCHKNLKDVDTKKSRSKASEKQDWIDATCSVCMEVPHNAVLLLCSSYNKGCRPYMCATSHRFSNCFEQYKKAYTKATSVHNLQPVTNNSIISLSAGEADDNSEVPELLCPLCRNQVKGWIVIESARKYLNAKKRTCMQDDCSFRGTYKELRKHVKSKHPFARPRRPNAPPIRRVREDVPATVSEIPPWQERRSGVWGSVTSVAGHSVDKTDL